MRAQALFPVFQWLVKHVLATREERAEQIRRFSELQFRAAYQLPEEADEKARHLIPRALACTIPIT